MTVVASVNDAELLHHVQYGDEQAFATLYHRYWRFVFGLALRILANPQDAEDVSQEVFVQLYVRPPKADLHQNFSAWLARVTTNRALNLARSRRRNHFHWFRWLRLNGQFPQKTPVATEFDDLALVVQHVLAQLSERDRALLALRTAGLSYEEIAAILGLRPTSIGALLARAERRFRRQYEAIVAAEEVNE